MSLTAHETKLIARLRRQERGWHRARWVLLAGGLLLAVLYAWLLWKVCAWVSSEREPGVSAFILALSYPKIFFGMTIAAVAVAYTVLNWWGSPTRVLLLKLLDEASDRERGVGHSAEQDAPLRDPFLRAVQIWLWGCASPSVAVDPRASRQ